MSEETGKVLKTAYKDFKTSPLHFMSFLLLIVAMWSLWEVHSTIESERLYRDRQLVVIQTIQESNTKVMQEITLRLEKLDYKVDSLMKDQATCKHN